MPVPVVIVELAPPDSPPPLVSALVTACSRAVERGRCSLVSSEPDDVVPHAIAIVSWQGAEQLRVRIEVGIRRAERSQWLSRTMSFRAEDDPAERWKAAGLTIATLVGEVAPPIPPSDTGHAPPAKTTTAPKAPPSKTAQARGAAASNGAGRETQSRASSGDSTAFIKRPLTVGLHGLVGRGIESGALRVGAATSLGYRFGAFPLTPLVSARWARQVGGSDSLAASWFTLGAGGSVGLPLSASFEIRARTEFILQRVGVTASDANLAASDSGVQWQPGWLLGSDALWAVSHRTSLVLGAEGWSTPGRITIRVHGEPVGSEPSIGLAGRFGVQFALP